MDFPRSEPLGKVQGNEALFIKGPATHNRQKIVIFAGGAKEDSYKKIRGNSYGMWIATEINLHHDNTIKEAFNRQLAAKRLKVFWDLNPDNPRAAIYSEYIDRYQRQQEEGTFPAVTITCIVPFTITSILLRNV